jgi:hypothetical protein
MLAAAALEPRIDVRPFGFFALDPAALLVLDPVSLPAPAGEASIRFVIPNDASLRGRDIHGQALILHAPSAADWRLTNLLSDTIAR